MKRFAAALVPSTAHVYFPEIPAVEAERFESVRSWGKARSVAVLDLVPSFRESFAESGTWFHYRKDRHWNAAGHHLAADTLKPLLEKLLPRRD